ncbi:MAG: 16S rRNA (cytosine(1402)-N(4))-methyltransferase RsmH [Erysipelotrichaceae bacterium]
MKHYSVLLNESLDLLDIKADGVYVDGTLGRGGHSSALLARIPQGKLYCFDRDLDAIADSRPRLEAVGSNFEIIHASFSHLQQELNARGVNRIDGLILDLGVSSPQFDDAHRGFSYRYDAPLDMRMDQTQSLNAYEIINHYPYERLVSIFFKYGEEKYSKQVARKIEAARELAPIETTFQLVDIIKSALPAKVVNSKGHPAKKIFQAIRIEVNNELGEIEAVLDQGLAMLNQTGRISVISFQSLEDRIVKEAFNAVSKVEKIDKRIPVMPGMEKQADYRLVNKKVIEASSEELAENNRSHSAKLRVIERVKDHGDDKANEETK